jgi:hypothetical protein
MRHDAFIIGDAIAGPFATTPLPPERLGGDGVIADTAARRALMFG